MELTVRAVRGGNVSAATEEQVLEAKHARVCVDAALVLLLVEAHAVRTLGGLGYRQYIRWTAC